MLIYDAEGFLSFFYADEKRAIRMAIPSSTYSKGNYVLQKSQMHDLQNVLYFEKVYVQFNYDFNSIIVLAYKG